MRVRRHGDGEKGLQCGENRKGCVMSFPYQCLSTAILTSCPAGLTGICRLTPLPSPYTHTHTNSYTCELCTLMSRYSPGRTRGHTHASSKAGELFPLCGPAAFTHPAFSFQVTFSSRAPRSFHHKAICEAFNRSVPVCLSWIGA